MTFENPPKDNERIKETGQLMTYDEYEKIEHKTPYTLSLKSGPNSLYYFGERHSFDPADEQWLEVKKLWQEFIENNKDSKKIVFVEGGKRPSEKNEEQSILKHGGMGLATYLAKQEKIDTYSPEPDEKYERTELEKEFSREEIQYYYFARVVHQWNRYQDPKPDFESYINQYLKNDEHASKWPGFNFSLESMKKIHANIFKTPFNENDEDFFYNIINPVVLKTDINKVSRASSEIRDKYIVQQIEKYINDGYSIFAEYGASHVVMQEPLLKALLSNPKNKK